MHKGIMLIVKASERPGALKKAREFMDMYKENDNDNPDHCGDVWDWYQIGGRWAGQLAPMRKEYDKLAEKILQPDKDGFIKSDATKINQDELQKIWENLGALGLNPWSDHYNMPDDGSHYDVMPLSGCLDIVKEWQQNTADGFKEIEKADRWLKRGGNKNREGEPIDDFHMYGYCLELAAKIFRQDFSSKCNVYNIESGDFTIPEDIENYSVVMIDIHH